MDLNDPLGTEHMTTATLQRLKGMHDILPADSPQWQAVEQTAQRLFTAAGYQEIRTPLLESLALFQRGVGDDTDIVSKEMYAFEKGDRALALRPEGTAGVVRAFIENGLTRAPKPFKCYYHGPMFRYERPQAGRQRQFHQLGIEAFGVAHPAMDAEVIGLAWQLLQSLGVQGLTLHLNNIGDLASRNAFRTDLKSRLAPHHDALSATSQERLSRNAFRILDSKAPEDQAILALPEIQACITSPWQSPESRDAFAMVCELLTAQGIPYTLSPTLVRGLDYYNAIVFEITATHLGAQNAVCGGGRYDSLVETLGGPPTPAVGWGLGLERLLQLIPPSNTPERKAYFVTDCWTEALPLAQQWRALGWQIELDCTGRSFGKQLQAADKQGFSVALILGADDATQQCILWKDLKVHTSQTLAWNDVPQALSSHQNASR